MYMCSSAFFKTDLGTIKPQPTVPFLELLCITSYKNPSTALMLKSDLHLVTEIRNYALPPFSTTKEKRPLTQKLTLFGLPIFFFSLRYAECSDLARCFTAWVVARRIIKVVLHVGYIIGHTECF